MYLSKKQETALDMALDAMDYRNSGEKDEEQAEAYDTICAMLASSRKEKHVRRRNREQKPLPPPEK